MAGTRAINALLESDSPIHSWYRFVLSYPPHLVAQYLERFGVTASMRVLDPFCGTGTTLVECRKRGIPSVGTDAHPMACLASRVKTKWDLNVSVLRRRLGRILSSAEKTMRRNGLDTSSFDLLLASEDEEGYGGNGYALTEEEKKLLPSGFLSSRPLRRLLMLRESIQSETGPLGRGDADFFFLALANVIVSGAGNFAFGPEIYRTKPKYDYDVLGHFARQASGMIAELAAIQRRRLSPVSCEVYMDDARDMARVEGSVHAVITSPPYPNEKDYTRTTRVESILLRLIADKEQLRSVKESLLRSNTRNVFVRDTDGDLVQEFPSIRKVCEDIEARRIELNKTSGFERLYHRVVAHYFGGMRRHFRALYSKLASGSKCAYVVGDQLSFLMVHVKTARLLTEVAEAEGFRFAGCELWRERIGTKVRNARTPVATVRVREEILTLEKP